MRDISYPFKVGDWLTDGQSIIKIHAIDIPEPEYPFALIQYVYEENSFNKLLKPDMLLGSGSKYHQNNKYYSVILINRIHLFRQINEKDLLLFIRLFKYDRS